jgi:hypothetical protein
MLNKTGYKFLAAVLILSIILSSLSCGTKSSTAKTSAPHAPPRTGNITTGTVVDEVTQSLTTAGGMVTVSKPGDPLDGFVLNVPANAISATNTIKVSYAPITNQTFGADINPISPMVTIDNGGKEANQLVYVRIPAKIPDGYFAMGFIYDSKTKQLEGVPPVAADGESVTLCTRHFCDMFLSMISKTLLKEDYQTGFTPGIDDWQFTNYGSFIAPGGHCEGQSLSALWYYCTKPDGANTRLFGTYDNNGDQPATPGFQYDDSSGYRFASVVQQEINPDAKANEFWLNMGGKTWIKDENNKWKMIDVAGGFTNEMTWDLFAYSMQATNEPQLVVIWSAAGGGHAMICYGLENGNLCIADPNYPGNKDRRINFTNGKFEPYNSGANAEDIAAGYGHAYENIQYYAKTTVLDWSTIGSNWADFKNGTSGDTAFPVYSLIYMNDKAKWVPLNDGTKTPFDAMAINVQSLTNGVTTAVYVYKDGTLQQFDAKGNYDLQPGANKFGIEVVGKVNDKWKYIDFQYITVIYEAEETTTTTVKTTTKGAHPVITSFKGPTDLEHMQYPGATVQYTIKIEGGTPPYTENWSADLKTISEGKNQETITVPVTQLRNNGDGWWIYLTVTDSKGESAAWVDSVNMTHTEFVYGLTYEGVVSTEPTIPYKSFGN